MSKKLNLLALDLGASNGRGIVGRFDGKRLELEELHRFENNFVDLCGVSYWDSVRLYSEIKTSFSKYKLAYGDTLSGFGIDTWGVDYGLLDKNGQLLGNTIAYRMSTEADCEAVWKTVPKRELFDHTGIASLTFNTLFQLYARKMRGDVALENASTMLFMPDLLGYFLTGEKGSEYSIVSTSMMYNPTTRDWDYETLNKLGLPTSILTPVQRSCTLRGCLSKALSEELGMSRVPFAAIGEHDTASAVAAVPAKSGDFAFVSSGTWSLFGIESSEAILTDDVYNFNYTNEGTIQGNFRILRNIMGLWLIQECRRDWIKAGENLSWGDIVELAKSAAPLRSIIDPDFGEFFAGGNMCGKIQEFCRKTGQPVPESKGEIARCIYESLALKYRWAIERLEEICGRKLNSLNIVGGGTQNKLLNQMVADAIDRPVITGPIEGACIGNLLGTAMALGEISGIDQLREVVAASFDVEEYTPHTTQAWQDAYAKLLEVSKD